MNPMKKLLFPLLAVLLSGSVVSAQTVLTAVGGNITTAGNWNNGLPVIGSPAGIGTININGNFSGNISSWEVNHTGGTLTSSSNRNIGATSASAPGTIWNVNGGTLDFGANAINRGTIGSNYAYTMNLISGSIIAGTAGSPNAAIWNVSGGNLTVGTWLAGSGNLNLTGGTVNFTTLDADGSGALVTFGLGNAAVTAGSLIQNANTNINFLTGSGGSLNITGFTSTDYETMWSNTRLRFNGANTGAFADHFQVSGSTLSVIPEPSTWALLALGLTAMVVLRRRRMA